MGYIAKCSQCHGYPPMRLLIIVCLYLCIHRNCSGPASDCQESSVTLDIEVVSKQPRAFVVENIISTYEADEIVR